MGEVALIYPSFRIAGDDARFCLFPSHNKVVVYILAVFSMYFVMIFRFNFFLRVY